MTAGTRAHIEPITLTMIVVCYLGWGLATAWLPLLSLTLAIPVTAIFITLHSSLQHEVLHGHPTQNRRFNELLVFPAPGLLVPYQRFRDLHIAHHQDEILTDPYDDPESNYLDPIVWSGLPGWQQRLLRFNNTLLGRILLGPAISTIAMLKSDARQILRGDRRVAMAWILHLAGLVPVFWWLVAVATLPFWAYLLAAYLGYGLLKIRTYLEHRAHAIAPGRTVIVEDRGLLALLFLNNNFHLVHHSHPKVPWYQLPGLYDADRETYLNRNQHYHYRSYAEVFGTHLLRTKDPVPHPLMRN
ncbi:MAG: fatty acid desaturase [Rhodobacteraceae bacterium]|nr:fatty acid desaturase [Paracoccaceae bacterium]